MNARSSRYSSRPSERREPRARPSWCSSVGLVSIEVQPWSFVMRRQRDAGYTYAIRREGAG